MCLQFLTVIQVVVSREGFRVRMSRWTRVLPGRLAALTLPEARPPCDCSDFLCSLTGRYNVGCTKRVGLFHSDRSKLQKAGATTHNRRRASKASLPTLTKDTKKQVRAGGARRSTLPSPPNSPLHRGLRHPRCFSTANVSMFCPVPISPDL